MSSPLTTNRPFLRLCAGQFLALAAGYAVHFVSAILIEDMTHASGPMSGLVLSVVAPGLLAGLWAGALVDRYHRGNLLVLSLVHKQARYLQLWYNERHERKNICTSI